MEENLTYKSAMEEIENLVKLLEDNKLDVDELSEKVKRIAALLIVIFLIAMIFVTLYCAITGSPYFMASLFTMLALPLLIYAYMFIYRIVKDKNEKK